MRAGSSGAGLAGVIVALGVWAATDAAPADTPLGLASNADTAGLAPAALDPPPLLTPSPSSSVALLGPRADCAAAAGGGPGPVSVPSASAVPEARP